jgi:hypothetical protein
MRARIDEWINDETQPIKKMGEVNQETTQLVYLSARVEGLMNVVI